MIIHPDRRLFLAGAALGLMRPGLSLAASRTLTLKTAKGRAIAVHHWTPAGRKRGRIVFSHGAASAPWKYDNLILPWVDAGWEVFAPLHVDSTDHPDTKSYAGLASWAARIEDMRALSDHLGAGRYVAAGHSYGGLTALVMGGVQATVPEGVAGPLADRKAASVLAFSPPPILPGLISMEGYATLAVPALIQTGTLDIFPGATGADPWRGHLNAYDAAAAGGHRYALVLDGVDHYFGGGICRPELPGPPQSMQLKQASDLSLLFLQGFALNDARGRAALDRRLAKAGPVYLQKK